MLVNRCVGHFLRPLKALAAQLSRRSLASQVARSSRYSALSDRDLAFFERNVFGGESHRCLTSNLDAYNTDWIKSCKGQSQLVLLPRSTGELSAILKHCNERKLAVCPQGGNTGLVGGSVPVWDEIVVSSKLMNKIIGLDTKSSILSCQSGCILQSLTDYLDPYGLIMPLDLGAKGSCHIGGNVSTNAGGLRLLRYGSLKGNVLGLEVVLADGTVLNSMKTTLRKDNTGYDLKQLFIGAEGTLGFISAVSILCPVKPKSVNVAFVACANQSFQGVTDLFKVAKGELNEILSAFEFMDAEAMEAVTSNLKLENPFTNSQLAKDCKFYCLIETHGSNDEHDRAKIEKLFDKLAEKKLCLDAVLAENSDQMAKIWGLRERIAESLTRDGFNYKYDISLPLDSMYNMVIDVRKRLESNRSELGDFRRCVGYGHLGDSNLHLNLTSTKYNDKLFKLLEPYLFEWTRDHAGSISAEHGLGLKKRNFIHYSKTPEMVDWMKRLKVMFDPNMILNPYKTIPE